MWRIKNIVAQSLLRWIPDANSLPYKKEVGVSCVRVVVVSFPLLVRAFVWLVDHWLVVKYLWPEAFYVFPLTYCSQWVSTSWMYYLQCVYLATTTPYLCVEYCACSAGLDPVGELCNDKSEKSIQCAWHFLPFLHILNLCEFSLSLDFTLNTPYNSQPAGGHWLVYLQQGAWDPNELNYVIVHMH